METTSVHRKLQKFAEPTNISVGEFLDLLKTSSRSKKMSIQWFTEGSADGSGKPPHTTQHLMWWDSSEYVGGSAGGSATKERQDQLNLLVTPGVGNWRTLSYENIDFVTFKGRTYQIR
jgi:hypothetical protein